MSIIKKLTDSISSDRARIERVMELAAEISGFNSDYISLTPGQRPQDYTSGSPFGFYLKNQNGNTYIQPILWDSNLEKWDDFGPPKATRDALDNRIQEVLNTLSTSLEGFIESDPGDVSNEDPILNQYPITQAEYDAISEHVPGTLYLIVE